MRLPEENRDRFKEPIGKLFENSEEAFDYFNNRAGEFEEIITVGDFVSAEFLKEEIYPDIIIVDFTIERSPAGDDVSELIEEHRVTSFEVENPAGHITDELWDVIHRAETPVKIFVDGEEDLAVVPAILRAPVGSLVSYGQPEEGMVFVEVDRDKKEEIKELVKLFVEE